MNAPRSKWSSIASDDASAQALATKRDEAARALARDLYVHDAGNPFDAIAAAYLFIDAWDALNADEEPKPKAVILGEKRLVTSDSEQLIKSFRRARAARNREP